MNITQSFIALHYCVQNLNLLHFRVKFSCPCIPKLMFHIRLWVHRFLIIYQFPKSNCMIHRTQRPLFFFIGLNVLCFMFQKTTMSYALWFQRLKCLLSFTFTRLQCLRSFTFSKTSMSSFFYIFKDFNVFCPLHFQRLQCILFYDSRTTMSFVLWFQRLQHLQSFKFTRLQCL